MHPSPVRPPIGQVQQEARGLESLDDPFIKGQPPRAQSKMEKVKNIFEKAKRISSTTASLLAIYSMPGTALTTLSGLILIMSICPNYKFKQSQ